MIDIRNISVDYGRVQVIRGASFDLAAGQVTALIGPNGTGKSSLLKALGGLLPAGGTVSMDGQVLTPARRQARIAYMPQDTAANSSLSLIEIVLLGRLGRLGLRVPADLVTAAVQALATFGLDHLQHRTTAEVSGGQRQLTFLAQALFRQPDVLLLDEPTAALDLRHQLIVLGAVRDFARQQNRPVLIALHDLSLAAQFADRMICLHQGRVHAAGAPTDVLTAPRLRDVYGVIARVDQGHAGAITVTPLAPVDGPVTAPVATPRTAAGS